MSEMLDGARTGATRHPRSGSGLESSTLPAEVLEHVAFLLGTGAENQPQEDALTLLDAVVRRASRLVGASEWASITVVRRQALTTLVASDPSAERADALQYELRSGPCIDAAVDDSVYVASEIRRDERWPEYGRRVQDELGVHSVLAFRLQLLGDDSTAAALNVYSTAPYAFGDEAVRDGTLLATQCALLVSAHLANDRAENLVHALDSNREIGVAMGVLMHRHRVSREEAFAMLRMASQDANRKLHDVATHVADTGELPFRRLRRSGGAPA